MEIRVTIFLFFASITVITNTILIVFAYKAFANVTTRVTAGVSELGKNSEFREFIESLQLAAEQAVVITEATRRTMAEFEPSLARAQENYSRTLARVDARLEEVAEVVDAGGEKMRDLIARPAFSAMSFVAGLTGVIETMATETAETAGRPGRDE